MEWKQLEIERLNGLLIRQAAVIEKIQDERDALKAELEAHSVRPRGKSVFPEIVALCAERDRLRALLLHVANNGEFDEGACKDWRGWIKHQMGVTI